MKYSNLISLLLLSNLVFSPLGYSQQPPEPRNPNDPQNNDQNHKHRKNPPEPNIPGNPPEPHIPNTPPEPHNPNTPPEPHVPPRPPQPPQPPEPHVPPPTIPSADLNRVRMVAREQGNMMANRVVAIYAEGERELRSFDLGLIEGINLYNFGSGSIQRNSDYLSGERRGTQEGHEVGYAQGQQLGTQDGGAQGTNMAADRFTSVVDQNVAPDIREPQVTTPVRTFDVNRPPVKSLEERFNEKNAEFWALLNRHNYSYEDYTAGSLFDGGTVTLWQLYQMGGNFRFNRFVDSYARADWAWDAWQNRSLGGRYSNALQYFREISDSSQTSNAYEAKRVFVEEFKSQYDGVISPKWRDVVRVIDPLMRNEGLMMGTEIGREYAQDLGYDHGYRTEFSAEAQTAYPAAFHQTFSTRFNATVNYYQTHGVPAQLTATLQADAGVFLPGGTVSVVVSKVANAGRLDGQFQVSLSSSVVKALTTGVVNVAAGKSLAQPVTLAQAGQITMNVTPDTDQQVVVTVGETQTSLTLRVSFANVVTALGSTTDNQTANMLTDYLRQQLAQEWNAGKVSGYTHSTTLLEQLVRVFHSTAPAQRINIVRARETLRSAFGAQPSLFSGKRATWKTAQTLIDQLR